MKKTGVVNAGGSTHRFDRGAPLPVHEGKTYLGGVGVGGGVFCLVLGCWEDLF